MDQTIDQQTVHDSADWVRRWDDQQQHYMVNREERFDVILDVVAEVTGGAPRAVLDLCCGPGSLAARGRGLRGGGWRARTGSASQVVARHAGS